MEEKKCNCPFAFEEGGIVPEVIVSEGIWDIESVGDFIETINAKYEFEIYEDHKGIIRGYTESDYSTIDFYMLNEKELKLAFENTGIASVFKNDMSKTLSGKYEFYRNDGLPTNMVMVHNMVAKADEEFEKGGGLGDEDDKFSYMMLSRLQSDCDYYLGYGNRSENILRADNVDDHIK